MELQLTAKICQSMGGAVYDEEIPTVNVTSCYFDMCVMDKGKRPSPSFLGLSLWT